jgi:hypothetical protein
MKTSQQNQHPKNRTSRQTELPLANQSASNLLSAEVIAQCRLLIAQLLREVLLAQKEANDEH